MAHWPAGTHTSTFLGNAVNLAAGRAAIEVMRARAALGALRAARRGTPPIASRDLADVPQVGEVRGLGLFIGIELVTDRRRRARPTRRRRAAIRRAAFERGVLVGVAGHADNVLKICPPLTIAERLLDAALERPHRIDPREPHDVDRRAAPSRSTTTSTAPGAGGVRRRRSRAATPRPASSSRSPRDRRVEDRGARDRGRPRRTFDDGAWPTTSGPRAGGDPPRARAPAARGGRAPGASSSRREMGKPIRYVREREIEPAIDRIRFYAGAARLITGEIDRGGRPATSSTSCSRNRSACAG